MRPAVKSDELWYYWPRQAKFFLELVARRFLGAALPTSGLNHAKRTGFLEVSLLFAGFVCFVI
jgi:hypothetical protein